MAGWDEFNWAVQEHPELAWQAILEAIEQPRMEPYLGTLAAGPLEDLLSLHGNYFIQRVEAMAKSNPRFASVLGGVWQHTMTAEVWSKVQAVRDRRGWDGVPRE
jgi:hypothetical protein